MARKTQSYHRTRAPRRTDAPGASAPSRLVLFNKPFGVLCQFRATPGTSTLAEYLRIADVHPAGRLDRDSEGLLLLTDDGRLQHAICHPRHKRWKTYWVQVEGCPQEPQLAALRAGLQLADGPTLPAQAQVIAEPALWPRDPPIRFRKSIPTAWIEIRIREGRNRQVRRMTASVGLPTLRLVRVAIGDWTLDDLAPGEWRILELSERSMASQRARDYPPGRRFC